MQTCGCPMFYKLHYSLLTYAKHKKMRQRQAEGKKEKREERTDGEKEKSGEGEKETSGEGEMESRTEVERGEGEKGRGR